MKTKHIIQLTKQELVKVRDIIRRGNHNARTITRARVLLLSHEGGAKNTIADTLGINRTTVQDIRDRYRNKECGGLPRALYDAPRSGQPPKVDASTEAHLVALACSNAPKGRERWTLELLQKRLWKDKKKKISTVAIWHHLNDRDIKPWREKNVVHPQGDTGIH